MTAAPTYTTSGIFNRLDLEIVWDLVVLISICFPSVSVTITVKPPVIVIGGSAMMKGVAVSESSATPVPQSRVTVFAEASVRLIEGVSPLATVTSAAPHSTSLLLPVILIEAILAVPLS